MAANALFRFHSVLAETVASPFGGNNSFVYTIPEQAVTLSESSTPVVDTVYSGLMTLSGGNLTVDFTSLARTGRTALTLSGLVIYGVRIENMGANPMTFVKSAANGYDLFTLTTGHVVGAGGTFMQYQAAGFGTVGAGALSIDVAGTAAQTFRIGLAAGTP